MQCVEFQCFPNNQQNVSQPQFKAKYKFTVFNSRGEEIPTTVYTGTQQVNEDTMAYAA